MESHYTKEEKSVGYNLPSYPFPTPCPLTTASHRNKSDSLMGPSLSMPFLSSGASACQLSSSLMRRRAAPREEEDDEMVDI